MNLKEYLEKGGDPNAYDDRQHSLLYTHILKRENVKLLLESGADPNQYAFENCTLLELCCYHPSMVTQAKLLLEYGAKVDFMTTRENTILHTVYDKCYEVIPLLIQKGADVNAENQYGMTPLYHALNWKKFKVATELLKHKPKMSKDCLNLFKSRLPDVYRKFLITHKWSLIKCAVKLLALHQRAIITANHPLRMLERGEFTC